MAHELVPCATGTIQDPEMRRWCGECAKRHSDRQLDTVLRDGRNTDATHAASLAGPISLPGIMMVAPLPHEGGIDGNENFHPSI